MSADVEADAVGHAVAVLGDLARCQVPLGTLTTYRVGGAAAVLVKPTARHQLHLVAEAARVSGLPVLVIGRGSNMLVADDGFAGIVVSTTELDESVAIDVDGAIVTAPAGTSLPVLARQTAAAGLTGFEWAVGVPGSLGGAVRMNAGGHGSDMAASISTVDVFGFATGAQRTLGVAELGLGFRTSTLGPDALVLAARLQLAPGDAERSATMISEIVAWRRLHQPGGQNAGSVFVNPVPGEISAGALIDAAGLRGHRLGTAHVSEKHANFIQADEGGRADDVRALMTVVRDRVEEASGFRLRSEIRLIGFADESDDG